MAPEPTTTNEPKNTVKAFSGEQKDFQEFTDSLRLHFALNPKYFDSDEKKLTFTLSRLLGDKAALWRTTYLQSIAEEDGEWKLPTWKAFWEEVVAVFRKPYLRDEAIAELNSMRQKPNETVETCMHRFRNLAAQAKIDFGTNDFVIIDYLRRILRPAIVNRVMEMETEPVEAEKWIKMAEKFDQTARRNHTYRTAFGTNLPIYQPTYNNYRNFAKTRTAPDPNAMDIDTLSMERQNELRAKNACFYCERPGHQARQCRVKHLPQGSYTAMMKRTGGQPKTSTSSSFQGPATASNRTPLGKQPPREQARHIRSIMASLTPEEQEQVFAAAAELEAEEKAAAESKDF